jgi:hypothetical protein
MANKEFEKMLSESKKMYQRLKGPDSEDEEEIEILNRRCQTPEYRRKQEEWLAAVDSVLRMRGSSLEELKKLTEESEAEKPKKQFFSFLTSWFAKK